MAAPRFPTVRGLYDAFPSAEEDIGLPVSDEACLPLLHTLATGHHWLAAISLCAYLLPRREAVQWGCQSLEDILPPPAQDDAELLDIAQTWARDPNETNRRMALASGTDADLQRPAAWMALAAGWSGGSIAPPQCAVIRPAPEQTARAIRAGLLVALCDLPREALPARLTPCLTRATNLLQDDRNAPSIAQHE